MNSWTAASMYSVFESGRYLNVTPLNTLSRNKRRKNCEESRWRSQSAPVCPLAMSCLDTKISLVPISINSWYLQPYWTLQHTSEQTKPQSHKETYTQSTDIWPAVCITGESVTARFAMTKLTAISTVRLNFEINLTNNLLLFSFN